MVVIKTAIFLLIQGVAVVEGRYLGTATQMHGNGRFFSQPVEHRAELFIKISQRLSGGPPLYLIFFQKKFLSFLEAFMFSKFLTVTISYIYIILLWRS